MLFCDSKEQLCGVVFLYAFGAVGRRAPRSIVDFRISICILAGGVRKWRCASWLWVVFFGCAVPVVGFCFFLRIL